MNISIKSVDKNRLINGIIYELKLLILRYTNEF